ncbi:YybH family protein [Rhodoblastus sp.]|uniref:YybH family protein n=1 Tax=Rhodoblastus sp. TaxID=1962975 RepID=UPI003F9E2A7C
MKLIRIIVAGLIAAFAATYFASAKEDIRGAMQAANTEFLSAYNNLKGDAFAAMYAKDAVVMPPGSQPIMGAEAIGKFWADRIKPGNRKNHTYEILSVQRDGKLAYQTNRYTLDVVDATGAVKKVSGNAVRVFEKGPNGKWLIKVHIFNVD